MIVTFRLVIMTEIHLLWTVDATRLLPVMSKGDTVIPAPDASFIMTSAPMESLPFDFGTEIELGTVLYIDGGW